MKLKKQFSAALAVIMSVSAMGLTACGGSGSGEDISFDENGKLVPSSGTTVKVWAYCDGDEENRTYELCQAFNKKYKDYNIKASFTPYASSSWETKMKATLSSSTGPDVFLCADGYYKQWATLGYMENLDPYITSEYADLNMENEIASMFDSGVGRYYYDVNTATAEGDNAHYYGLPKGTGATAVYYNKTYMKNAGIEELSVYEEEMDAYNAEHGTAYPKKAYFKYTDGKYYFNNKIAMNWEECADIATVLQGVNKRYGCEYGFFTSWWFNYGFSVGGSCIGHVSTADEAYYDGYYTFTLADSTVNYKVKESISVNGTAYGVGEIVDYEDKFYMTDELAAKCDVLPSQRHAFAEYLSLAGGKDSTMYNTEAGVTDKFYELIPYKLAGASGPERIDRNDAIMKNNTNEYVPTSAEKAGELIVVKNKGISAQPSKVSTDGKASLFYNGKTAMLVDVRATVQDCRDAMTDDWDVAPMLVYKEYDEDNNVTLSGINGAHSGSTAWAVWNKSTIKNAAYLFVKFASGEEGQRILSKAGTIIANQKNVAEEMTEEDLSANKKPSNIEIFSKEAMYQTPGDWWFLKDGDWIDAEGCWANYLNQTVRNGRATLNQFYTTNDYKNTFDLLRGYTRK